MVPPTAVAIYCRISQDSEGRQLGVKRQEIDCRALCDARGWPIAEVFVDNDLTAFKRGGRPAYRAMFEAAKNGLVDAIVVWHLDRLYRHPLDLEEIIDLVEASGITVATVTGGDYDLSTTDGRAMARVIVTFARKESEDKSRRTRRKHLELAQAGQPVGSGRPFGYELDRLTIRPAEAELVRDAARRVLAGESVRSVALDWQREGILSPHGNAWTPSALRKMLMRPRVAGLRSLDGVVVAPAVWPAILDQRTFDRLCLVLDDPARRTNGFGARRYLLTGFLWCGRCGARLVARRENRRGREIRHHVCPSDPTRPASLPTGACGGVRVQAEPLEAYVVESVLVGLDDEALDERLAVSVPEGVEELESQAADIQARLVQLGSDVRLLSHEAFLAADRTLNAQLAGVRAQLRSLEQRRQRSQWKGRGSALASAWPGMELGERRAVLASLVERIVVAPLGERRSIGRFDRDRVHITWSA